MKKAPEHKQTSMSVLKVWLQIFSVPKRARYTALSLLVCALQLILLISDAIMDFVTHDFPPWRTHIHFILVVSFYWSLLGSVYALLVDDRKTACVAQLSVLLNLGTCISRFCYELMQS